MKHSLSLLCLVITGSLFQSHNATAEYLLEHNPTPIELNSFSVSDDSYQVAGVYHIVDYSKKMESFFGKRVNDDGKDISGRNCAKYGFVDSCGDGTGIVVHPTVGLTCYKNCKAPCSSLGYVDKCPSPQTGTAVTTEDGSTCYKDCKCPITYRYTTSTTLTAKMLGRVAFVNHCASPALVSGEKCSQTYVNTTTSQTETAVLYKECNCPNEYNSATVQADRDCTPCTNGNGVTQYACVDSQVKPDSCDTERGWMQSTDNTCSATDCPSGFTAGVTSCTSGSTKPDLTLNGWSGGQQCGMCSCKNTTDCSAYTLTTASDANANYTSCSTGCGSAAKTTYKFENCKASYFDTENYWCSVPVTDCATLGYNKTTSYCSGKQIVKCPFDETKIACFANK